MDRRGDAGISAAKENTMLDFRTFTKEDWYAFAGAERFSDGRDPRVAELEVEGLPATVVHDGAGVQITWMVGDVTKAVTVDASVVALLEPQLTFDQLVDLPGYENLL